MWAQREGGSAPRRAAPTPNGQRVVLIHPRSIKFITFTQVTGAFTNLVLSRQSLSPSSLGVAFLIARGVA